MADWEIALEKQLDTWLFYSSPRGQSHLDGYVQSVDRKYEDGAYARAMANGITSALWQADPVYVTPEMMTLLEAAWPAFEPEPIRQEDLLLPAGFVYLPRPVQTIDIAGKRMTHRGIVWMQAQDPKSGKRGVVVYTFGGTNDPDDYKTQAIADYGERYDRDFVRFFGSSLALGHMTTVWYGSEWWTAADSIDFVVSYGTDEMVRGENVQAANRAIAQFIGAMWRLLEQRVGVGFRQRPSRPSRKRVAKAGWEEKYVTVVTLRRPKQPTSGEHANVDWTHRWVVSGHWRWQPYKDGTHRQIWIAPYVKGPDDKPLVVRGARIFRLAR